MLTQLTTQAAPTAIQPGAEDERYAERAAAGRRLAERLRCYRGGRAVVLALPPGGLNVASEIAHALRLPLDVLAAREFAIHLYPGVVAGALCEGGGLCLNAALLRLPGVTFDDFWHEAQHTRYQIARMINLYRRGEPLPRLVRRPVILVDDGLGSGLLQLAALAGLRHFHPERCIIATPAGTQAALEVIARSADAIVTLDDITEDSPSDAGHSRQPLGDGDALARIQHAGAPI